MSKEPGTLVLRVTADNAKELYQLLGEAAGLPSLASLSGDALDARQKLQASDQLARGVAHDVNNMLR